MSRGDAPVRTRGERGGDEYAVRPFRRGDEDAVLSLLERWLYPGLGDVREAWFDWRFVDNPFADEVPITVVERDGEVVAAESNLPIPMTVGSGTELAILQAESVVHEDHRRRGVFSRMFIYDEAYYARREPVVSIGTPLEATMRAIEKRGDELHLDRSVAFELPKYFRCRDPTALADGTKYERLARPLRLVAPVVRLGLAALEALSVRPSGVTVRHYDGAQVDLLASLADECGENGRIHAVRDRRFYRWRYANPRCEYDTFAAQRGGRTVASIVTERLRGDASDVVRVVDVLPLPGSGGRTEDLQWVLAEVVRAVAPAPIIALGSHVPRLALVEHGFYPNSAPPLSWLTKSANVVARPLDGGVPEDDAGDVDGGGREGEWTINGCRLTDPSNWSLSWGDVSFG